MQIYIPIPKMSVQPLCQKYVPRTAKITPLKGFDVLQLVPVSLYSAFVEAKAYNLFLLRKKVRRGKMTAIK